MPTVHIAEDQQALDKVIEAALDLTAPMHGVTVEIDESGTKLWVNVDGVCALRICRCPRLEVNDAREALD
jgi:hypothetical protein